MSDKSVACGGCGQTDKDKRCINCLHNFEASPPTNTVTISKAEYDALVADAERYRFLREGKFIHNGQPFIARNHGASFSQWTNEHADKVIDQAIDSARKANHD